MFSFKHVELVLTLKYKLFKNNKNSQYSPTQSKISPGYSKEPYESTTSNYLVQEQNDNLFSNNANISEKRLLVKLLKASNLNSNFIFFVFKLNEKITYFKLL
jgi:hypothetical protein